MFEKYFTIIPLLFINNLFADTYIMKIENQIFNSISLSKSFNIDGFDNQGNHKDTNTVYNPDGFDINGFDINGYNVEGYDSEGYNINGFDLNGYHKLTNTLYDLEGFNKAGLSLRQCNFNSNNYMEYIYTASNSQPGLYFRYLLIYWDGIRKYSAGYNDQQTADSIEQSWNNRTLGQLIDISNGIYEQTNQSQSTYSDTNNVLSPYHDFQYGERRGVCATSKRP
jgi:hypothetical protein